MLALLQKGDNILKDMGGFMKEDSLKKRDKIHDSISLLCDILPVEDVIRIGIKKRRRLLQYQTLQPSDACVA